MAGRLTGKVVLISGAARGIGAAQARLFAAEGAAVVLGDIREQELKSLSEELRAQDAQVETCTLDVTEAADWEAAVELAERTFGKVNGLINNAGILSMAGYEDTTIEVWDRIIAVNQTGVFLGTKAVVPAMRRAGGGSVLNISSIFGIVGSGGATAYQASKGAVRLMTKTAAVQYVGDGIRFNSLHPGAIDTSMLEEEVPDEALSGIVAATPMQRMGRPEEVALAACYLVSDESSYVTGSELVIDGGYTAQ
jgi:NAD(P)-dependent dehydrogenase (short-subunit alcohol dehydrogenase family)